MFRSEQGVIPGSEPQNYDDILRKQKVFSQCSCAVNGRGLRAAVTEAVRTAASSAVIGRGLSAAVTAAVRTAASCAVTGRAPMAAVNA